MALARPQPSPTREKGLQLQAGLGWGWRDQSGGKGAEQLGRVEQGMGSTREKAAGPSPRPHGLPYTVFGFMPSPPQYGAGGSSAPASALNSEPKPELNCCFPQTIFESKTSPLPPMLTGERNLTLDLNKYGSPHVFLCVPSFC